MFGIPVLDEILLTLFGLLAAFAGYQHIQIKDKKKEVDSLKSENKTLEVKATQTEKLVQIQSEARKVRQEVEKQNEEDLRAPDKYSRN